MPILAPTKKQLEYNTSQMETNFVEETEWIRVQNKCKKKENVHFRHSSTTATGELRTTTTKGKKKDTTPPPPIMVDGIKVRGKFNK